MHSSLRPIIKYFSKIWIGWEPKDLNWRSPVLTPETNSLKYNWTKNFIWSIVHALFFLLNSFLLYLLNPHCFIRNTSKYDRYGIERIFQLYLNKWQTVEHLKINFLYWIASKIDGPDAAQALKRASGNFCNVVVTHVQSPHHPHSLEHVWV